MKLGLAAPISLNLLNINFKKGDIPEGYTYLESPLIARMANGLIERGVDLTIYNYAFHLKEPKILKKENVTICIGRAKSHTGRRLFDFERKDLVKLMKDHPADLIHAHWSYEFAWAAIDSGIPTLVSVHDNASAVLKYNFDAYRLIRWVMNQIVLKKAKYLAAVSPYILENIDKSKSRIIPNFFDKKLQKEVTRPITKANYLISVSNYDKLKNINNALKAFAILKKNYPDLEYRLIGEGMEPNGPANEYAQKNKLDQGVKFLGPKPYETVLDEIKKAKVFLHPSKEESFGLSVLEAMVLGTPVVGGENSGNIPFLLNYGKTGEICNINSPKNIATKIALILNDEEHSKHLIKEALSYVNNNYSEETFFKSLFEYYNYIMETENLINHSPLKLNAYT